MLSYKHMQTTYFLFFH